MNKARVRSILIAVATYRRPEMLASLLESLQNQKGVQDLRVKIVVVDNDPMASAKDVCNLRFPSVEYFVEATPGISAARNAGVDKRGDVDAVAFIDDDEYAHEDWLSSLARVLEEYEADVVAGPVCPVYPAGTPKWIVRQGWFERQSHRTGSTVKWPATNNAMVRRTLLDHEIPPFRAEYSLSGGEDADFFDRCRRSGAKFIWSAESVVFESIPPDRTTPRWLWRRMTRLGNTSAVMMLRQRSIVTVLSIGGARTVIGILGAPLALLLRHKKAAVVISQLPRGIGMITALCGHRVIEYRRRGES